MKQKSVVKPLVSGEAVSGEAKVSGVAEVSGEAVS